MAQTHSMMLEIAHGSSSLLALAGDNSKAALEASLKEMYTLSKRSVLAGDRVTKQGTVSPY